MKFTLKNRPKNTDATGYVMASKDVNEWFEGFEKEVRESTQYYETMWNPRTPYNKGVKQGLIDKSKEILGE